MPQIRRCVGSVRNQRGVTLEYIVNDACSTDGTTAWIKDQADLLVESRPDQGMYDAINRGWSRATGDILSWLNADEQYLPGALEYVRDYFEANPDVDAIFGDYILVDVNGRPLGARKEIPLRRWYVANGVLYAQSCTIFVRRRVFDELGGFDISYRILGDVEWVLRLMEKGIKFSHMPRYLGLFTLTDRNLSLNRLAVEELNRVRGNCGAYRTSFGRFVPQLARRVEKLCRGCYGRHKVRYRFMKDEKQYEEIEDKTGSLWQWSGAGDSGLPPNICKVLVAGQTPPPFHGQAIMIQQLLEGHYEHAILSHVRMNFSRDIADVGRWQFAKLFRLASAIFEIIYKRFREKCRVLYYPPAGPHRIPFYRDVCILCATRWLFRKVIFHFHAAGLSELYQRLNWMERLLFKLAYAAPDIAISMPLSPKDGRLIRAGKEFIVPNGIKDVAGSLIRERDPAAMSRILYIGVLSEAKGVLVALEAMGILAGKGLKCHMEFIGAWESSGFKDRVENLILSLGIQDYVTFSGVKSGGEKDDAFIRNGILCFPTYYEAESFGLVLLEGMMFSMPIVATTWRGIPAVVDDGRTGLLVPIRESRALADKIECLILNPDLAKKMGACGREKFLSEFTDEKFREKIDEVFEYAGRQC